MKPFPTQEKTGPPVCMYVLLLLRAGQMLYVKLENVLMVLLAEQKNFSAATPPSFPAIFPEPIDVVLRDPLTCRHTPLHGRPGAMERPRPQPALRKTRHSPEGEDPAHHLRRQVDHLSQQRVQLPRLEIVDHMPQTAIPGKLIY